MAAQKDIKREVRADGKEVLVSAEYIVRTHQTEFYTNLEEAKEVAERTYFSEGTYQYVVSIEGGYVVLGYADLWIFFGDPMKDAIVYKLDGSKEE